uniref:hypothetical protein n=1 Tax=Acidiphilium sp. TaxID=527 RepID=UPI0025910021
MARATTSRSPARGGKGAGARKGAAAKSARGAAKAVKASAPKPAPKAAAKLARASTGASAGAGREQLAGRIDQLERNIASLRTRHAELKRALADLAARIETHQAAPAKPARRR